MVVALTLTEGGGTTEPDAAPADGRCPPRRQVSIKPGNFPATPTAIARRDPCV